MQFIADGHKLLQLYCWNGINQEHYMHHLPRRNPPGGTLWNFSLLRQHLNKFSLNKNLSAGIKWSKTPRSPSSTACPFEKCSSSCSVAANPSPSLFLLGFWGFFFTLFFICNFCSACSYKPSPTEVQEISTPFTGLLNRRHLAEPSD